MLMFDVPQQIQFIDKRGALQVKACERRLRFRRVLQVTGPDGSIHETPSTSKSLHYVSSRYYQLEINCFAHRTRIGSGHRRDARYYQLEKNCFAHRTRIGSRHRRDAKRQSMHATHFMRRC